MKKSAVTLLVVILIITTGALSQYQAEKNIVVKDITIETNNRSLAGLYATPESLSGDGTLPGVAVFHGFTASKEMMRPFLEGLARVGFAVIAIDQQGHGFSSGNLREDGENSLRNDGVAVINYLRDLPEVNSSEIAILGHSMGAGTAIATSTYLGDLGATVLLGNSLTNIEDYNVTPSFPENVLFGIGKYDELFTVEAAQSSFGNLTSSADPEIDTLYGDFANGTARELLVATTDHILEVINPKLVERSIEWIYRSLIEAGVNLSDPELDSVNGWSFIFDQLLTYICGLLIIGLIPLAFLWLPQHYTRDEHPIQWRSHGIISFGAFMLSIPLVIVFSTSFAVLFVSWYFLGTIFYVILQNQRDDTPITKTVRAATRVRKDVFLSIVLFSIIFAMVQLILSFVHWDFRYVLPLLSGLDMRRFGLFLVLFFPGIFFFSTEIHAMQGSPKFSLMEWGREIVARTWVFLLLLLLHYLPIILFQTPILPTMVGFLAFFIVGLFPVLTILSFITSTARSQGWSTAAQAIITSGLIAWMLASTLSFNA